MSYNDRDIKSIGEILEKNIVLQGADLLSAKGFTQIPNHIIRGSLSPGAKLAYSLLLSYAWHNDFAFPGQERMADDMGVTRQSVITLHERTSKKEILRNREKGTRENESLHASP